MAECVHKWNIDAQNVGTCSLCGEVKEFPFNKGEQPVVLKAGRAGKRRSRKERARSGPNTRKRAQYYKANKDAIIKDLLSTGRAPTCRKWGISKSSVQQLIYRWLTPEQRASMPRAIYTPQLTPSPGPGSGNGWLPPFPDFSGTWEAPVQLKWLEVYEKLTEATRNKE